MGMYFNFNPHSLYMGVAIKDDRAYVAGDPWAAYDTDNEFVTSAPTLKLLKQLIKKYKEHAK